MIDIEDQIEWAFECNQIFVEEQADRAYKKVEEMHYFAQLKLGAYEPSFPHGVIITAEDLIKAIHTIAFVKKVHVFPDGTLAIDVVYLGQDWLYRFARRQIHSDLMQVKNRMPVSMRLICKIID